jgi:hypothetical protein
MTPQGISRPTEAAGINAALRQRRAFCVLAAGFRGKNARASKPPDRFAGGQPAMTKNGVFGVFLANYHNPTHNLTGLLATKSLYLSTKAHIRVPVHGTGVR